jgi:hypothetical protein
MTNDHAASTIHFRAGRQATHLAAGYYPDSTAEQGQSGLGLERSGPACEPS